MYIYLPLPYIIDREDLRRFKTNIVMACFENKMKLKIGTRKRDNAIIWSRRVNIISGSSASGSQGKEESMNHPSLSLPEQKKPDSSSGEVTDTKLQ